MTKNYQKPEEWVNFGDVNPKPHGGIFVKWERDMWHIIETRHPEDLPEDFAKGRFYFMHYYMEEMDIWIDGKPENGFTDWAKNQLESISHKPFSLISENELPEDESLADYMDWVIENHGEWLIGSLAFSLCGYHHPYRDEFSEEYWNYLDRFGIIPDMA